MTHTRLLFFAASSLSAHPGNLNKYLEPEDDLCNAEKFNRLLMLCYTDKFLLYLLSTLISFNFPHVFKKLYLEATVIYVCRQKAMPLHA